MNRLPLDDLFDQGKIATESLRRGFQGRIQGIKKIDHLKSFDYYIFLICF
jgi:hypothetical protein